jgi:hypothetical protein
VFIARRLSVKQFVSIVLSVILGCDIVYGACIEQNSLPKKIGDFYKVMMCQENKLNELQAKVDGVREIPAYKQLSFETDDFTLTPRSISKNDRGSVALSLVITNKTDNTLLIAFEQSSAHLGDGKGLTATRWSIDGVNESSASYLKYSKNYTRINPKAMQPVSFMYNGLAEWMTDEYDFTARVWQYSESKPKSYDVSYLGIRINK